MPRDPSLTLGVTKRGARGDIPHPVVLRHESAEGPLADARGDKKGWLGVTKKWGLGVTKKGARGDKRGLKKILQFFQNERR